jgi:tetratricopeptide (TPR) repeat protein
VRKRTGPGPAAASLLVLASLLSGATAFMYCHKRLAPAHPVAIAPSDASSPGSGSAVGSLDLLDASLNAFVSDDAAAPAGVPADARVAMHAPPADAAAVPPSPRDAGLVAMVATVARDAAAPVAPTAAPADASVDKKKLAADLYAQAHAALEDGDPDKALQLADESLKLRRTQKTLLERARALQRLNRIDEAIQSVDEATEIDPKSAAAWEQRALIMWGAHRYDDAKQAMQKYLELDPEGRSADSFHHLIDNK